MYPSDWLYISEFTAASEWAQLISVIIVVSWVIWLDGSETRSTLFCILCILAALGVGMNAFVGLVTFILVRFMNGFLRLFTPFLH